MSDYKYDKSTLLEQTNGGLDVIKRLYPECANGSKFVHFKLREEEKTASTIVSKHKGLYFVKDFGSGDSYNAIDLVMEREGLNFSDACKWVAQTFGLNGNKTAAVRNDKMKFFPAEKNQKHGEYIYDYYEETPAEHLAVLGPLVTQQDLDIFGCRAVKSFTQIKEYPADKKQHKSKHTWDYAGKTMQIVTYAADNYPIFVFDHTTWQKIYQPLAFNKAYRFRYAGKKPLNYVFGLSSLLEYYHDTWKEDHITDENEEPKFKKVIIAGGDRDGLNVSSLGYPVVWLNSETAKLEYETLEKLLEISETVCYLGDIDGTGVKEIHKLALQYIDVHIIWLPEWIRESTDQRGKPKKDVTDWVKLVHRDDEQKTRQQFSKLVNTSLPARFWDVVRDKYGNFQKYTFNNEACYRFLNYNGFYRYEEDFAKDDYSFIQIKDGIVSRVPFHQVANFPAEWIRKKSKPISLLNFTHRSAQLTDKKLAGIKQASPDFKNHGSDFQRLFFKNAIWTVTKEGVTASKYDGDVHVWDDNIIDHVVTVAKTPSFKITKENNVYDIEILTTENPFLNYLINTSRIHWRVLGDKPYQSRINAIDNENAVEHDKQEETILAERETYRQENQFKIDEKGLSDEMVQEQKMCLINKIFSFGYLLHNQKIASKAWAVFAMDNKDSEISESNGGSGKSILFNKAVKTITRSYKYVNGGDTDLIKSQFLMDGVTRQTNYLIFDDIDSRFPMRKVFNNITGEFSVNPKFGKMFTMMYDESPKVAFTSNFGIFAPDGSTMRRLLFVPYSDYYHYHTDEYFEEFKVSADFGGKDLFTNFDEAQWNGFFNIAAECLSFFLNTEEKIDAPLKNVHTINQKQTVGKEYWEWADVYFAKEENLDTEIVKKEVWNDFKENCTDKAGKKLFKDKLKRFCKAKGYIYNPPEMVNSDPDRIISRIDGATEEMFYVRTSKYKRGIAQAASELPFTEDVTDDLDF